MTREVASLRAQLALEKHSHQKYVEELGRIIVTQEAEITELRVWSPLDRFLEES